MKTKTNTYKYSLITNTISQLQNQHPQITNIEEVLFSNSIHQIKKQIKHMQKSLKNELKPKKYEEEYSKSSIFIFNLPFNKKLTINTISIFQIQDLQNSDLFTITYQIKLANKTFND